MTVGITAVRAGVTTTGTELEEALKLNAKLGVGVDLAGAAAAACVAPVGAEVVNSVVAAGARAGVGVAKEVTEGGSGFVFRAADGAPKLNAAGGGAAEVVGVAAGAAK